MAKKKAATKAKRVSAYIHHDTTVQGAVESAFSGAEELKEELQTWFDNMPENLQGGSKGDELQEAIGTLEGLTQPDIPDDIASESCSYSERTGRKGQTRAARRDTFSSMLSAAAERAREKSGQLAEHKYNAVGEYIGEDGDEAPATEEARDEVVQDLDTFADECESAMNDLDGVDFPAMR